MKFDPALYVALSSDDFTKESLLTFIYAERRKELDVNPSIESAPR